MNRQDASPIAEPGQTAGQAASSKSTSLDRRRALLSGLSKGGALVAAAAPVSSFAVGRVKTADGKQCTVSGQMSAVMSQAASQLPCAAFHPTYFFSAVTVAIADLPDGTFKNSVVSANPGAYKSDGTAVYYKRNATEVRKLLPINRPANFNAVTLTVTNIFSTYTPTTQKVLKLLHSAPESDAANFVAAFFSAALTAPGGAEKVPFAANDVQTQWAGPNKVAAAALYDKICTEGADLSKLG